MKKTNCERKNEFLGMSSGNTIQCMYGMQALVVHSRMGQVDEGRMVF